MKVVRKELGLAPEVKAKKIPEIISWHEAEKVIAQAYRNDPVYGLILKFLWMTMVRVAELASLQIEDLHFDDGYAKIRAGKGSKDRLVVVPIALAQELKSYVGNRRRGPIFVSQQRRAFSTRRIEQIASQAAAAAKIQTHVTPHTFRRSMATALLNRGAREEVVSTLLGHESTETTRAAYARLSIQTLAVELERALSNEPTK
jgi:integrase